MASGAPARAPSLPLSRAGVSLRLTVSPSESSSESGSDLPCTISSAISRVRRSCAYYDRLCALYTDTELLPSHVSLLLSYKDPEHPNVLYNRTPVPQQGDQETKTTPGSSEQAIW